jgi:hypothetical protein
MNHTSFARALNFTLSIAAALHDGSVVQRGRIRREVQPMLTEFRHTGNMGPIHEKLQQIMGLGWQPGPEWMLKEKSDDGGDSGI